MKKIFLFSFLLCIVNVSFAQYDNSSLNGPWFIKAIPANPYDIDNSLYIVFDGAGKIVTLSGFCSSAGGTYSVSSSGAFSLNITCDSENWQVTGQLTSATAGTVTLNEQYNLVKVTDPGALAGTLSGTLTSENCGSNNVSFTLDNNGVIINSTGLTKPVSGRIYTEGGMFIGHATTGSSGAWSAFTIMGLYSTNNLTGLLGLDQNGCGNTSVNLVKQGAPTTINVTAGNLSSVLTSEQLNTLTSLKLKGTIDARDFKTMRDAMPLLAQLDLSETAVVAYTGVGGTFGTGVISYPPNTLPRNGLVNKSSLKSIILPAALKAVGRSALNSTGLTDISFPETVTKIDTLAFRNCKQLESITLPQSLDTIANSAFTFCVKLSHITISESVKHIGPTVFTGSRVYVSVDDNNLYYMSQEGVLFDKNKALLMYCPPGKEGVYFVPETVKIIDVDAFYNCKEITELILPPSLERIRDWAFENCTELTEIRIPASVLTIRGYAFYNCHSLQRVYAYPVVPVSLSASDSVFKYVDQANCVLYVPKGSKTAYQTADKWKDFQHIEEMIPESIELNNGLIAYYPFNGNTNDESGNGNHGTVYGATLTSDRYDKANSAYNFNGSSNYITINGIIDDIKDSNSYSVTGWFKNTDINHAGTIFSINKEAGIFNQNILMLIWVERLVYYSDDMTNNTYLYPVIEDYSWNFFTLNVTKNGSSTFYINDRVVSQTFTTNMNITPLSTASIGQEWDNTSISDLFYGQIDDIRVYNRTLNSEEIHALFNADFGSGVENKQLTGIKIFPNPTDGLLNIDLGFTYPEIQISISDITGRTIRQHKFYHTEKIDVNLDAPAGIYFLNINNGKEKGMYKVIKR